MTAKDLITRIDTFIEVLNPKNYVVSALCKMSTEFAEVRDIHFSPIDSTDNNSIIQGHKSTRSRLNNTVSLSKDISPRQVFLELQSIDAAVDLFISQLAPDESLTLKQIKHQLSDFSQAYERFIASYSYSDCLTFLTAADSLHTAVQATIDMLTVVKRRLVAFVPAPKDKERLLSVYLPTDDDFAVFAIRVEALAAIYAELCALLKLSKKQRELRVIKVESGSLWAELLGNPKVIGMLTSMLVGVAGYLYRKYTAEGKLAQIPKKVEVAESILGLRDDLESRGIDVSQMEDEIAKASVLIAGQMTSLFAEADEIEVNGEIHPITMAGRERLLQARTPHLLGPGEQPTHAEQEDQVSSEGARSAPPEEPSS
jgi:hypothetical protein